MPLYEMTTEWIQPLKETSFATAGIKERSDLQRLLRETIDIISPNTLVIAEEFGEWEDSRRRIDLLGLDKDANLIVIELKRTDDGGHMELQALRYAAMVSTMTFDQAVDVFAAYLKRLERSDDPRETILKFLDWEEPDDDRFAQDVRITLAAADFSREVTTAVLWLNERNLDLRCVRLRPYQYGDRVLLDVQQVIPLPEAADYQVRRREKAQQEQLARRVSGRDYTKFTVTTSGGERTNLPKRRAVLEVVKGLASAGAPIPEMRLVLQPFHSYGTWVICSVPGTLTSDEFVVAAISAAHSEGLSFDPNRYFVADEELLRIGGCTSAVNNQWGLTSAEAIDALVREFPTLGVSASPVEPAM
ncbi:MAG: hypothetical protein M3439_01705 [Chloroflexota bacterium]|nr:hypothetical protein [Chloroflexota bacterium]